MLTIKHDYLRRHRDSHVAESGDGGSEPSSGMHGWGEERGPRRSVRGIFFLTGVRIEG